MTPGQQHPVPVGGQGQALNTGKGSEQRVPDESHGSRSTWKHPFPGHQEELCFM